MKNKTANFLFATFSVLLLAAATAPSAKAGVVVQIGASFGPRVPAVYAPPVYAAPVVTYAPPVYYAPPTVVYRHAYVAPPPVAYVAPYYVAPSARFGYGCGLYGRPRYHCGWY